jgi:tetratricopeptide (TPR) repeat protein
MPEPASSDAPLPRLSWPARLPLAAVWCCALLPLALYALHAQDPVLAVEAANLLADWSLRVQHRAAVELDPSLPQAHHLLGQFLLRLGALQPAREAFQNAERLDPGHAFGESLLLGARAAALAGRLDEALEDYARHAARHGGGHRSHYFHGEALAAAGRADEAARAFAQAAADPGQRLPPEEAYYRALARVKRWRYRGAR